MRRAARRHGRGLTLIELMVTLAVLAFLLLVGISLGGDWLRSARTQQARSDLEQGWGLAKALALRNPCQVVSEEASAYLQLTRAPAGGYSAEVQAWGVPGNCRYVAQRGGPEWSAQLPEGVQVLLNGTPMEAGTQHRWLINSRGLLTQSASNVEVVVRQGGSQNDETIQWN